MAVAASLGAASAGQLAGSAAVAGAGAGAGAGMSSYLWPSVISAGATVGSMMLQPDPVEPNAPAVSVGNASQMQPMGTALQGPAVGNPNPAFGQFLGGVGT